MADHMRTLKPIIDAKFIAVARPLITLIETVALKLSALATMNRTIHIATYNTLITEAAAV
jgi:hypothetical protein